MMPFAGVSSFLTKKPTEKDTILIEIAIENLTSRTGRFLENYRTRIKKVIAKNCKKTISKFGKTNYIEIIFFIDHPLVGMLLGLE